MRDYRFQATDDTVNALRRLRGNWTGFLVTPDVLTVNLADGGSVRIDVEGAEFEETLEAYRLRARVVEETVITALDEPAGDFAFGPNDIVLFTGATWVEEPLEVAHEELAADGLILPRGKREGRPEGKPASGSEGDPGGESGEDVSGSGPTMQLSGHPGQLPESATAVCITTDSIVIATTAGTGVLVRVGLRPHSIEVVREQPAIASFMIERGYSDGM